MSAWEIVNLREIDDSAQTEDVQARFARKHLGSRDLGVSLFVFAPNFRSPVGHSHREQEEAYVVVEGSGRVLLDDEVRELSPWDCSGSRRRSFAPSRAGPRDQPHRHRRPKARGRRRCQVRRLLAGSVGGSTAGCPWRCASPLE